MKKKKTTLFLISFNQLDKSFWSHFLNLQDDHQFYQFSSGEEAIQNIEMDPDLVIIDTYFSTGKMRQQESILTYHWIKKNHPGIKTYFLSPGNDPFWEMEIPKEESMSNEVSTFNSDFIQMIRNEIGNQDQAAA